MPHPVQLPDSSQSEPPFQSQSLIRSVIAGGDRQSIYYITSWCPPCKKLYVVFPAVFSWAYFPVTSVTVGPPIFNVIGDVGRGPFIVFTIDSDAYVPPTNQVRQSLAANLFRGSPTSSFLLTNTTPAITDYIQPQPPAGSKPHRYDQILIGLLLLFWTFHRYIFLLFDQPNNFNNQTLITSTTPIYPFNLSQFVNEAGLGDPIGGTFMRVGPDASSS